MMSILIKEREERKGEMDTEEKTEVETGMMWPQAMEDTRS